MTTPKHIAIATYNVHGCVGSDGRRDSTRIAQVVEELQADVIALQELPLHAAGGVHAAASEVLEHLPGYRAVFAPARLDAGIGFGNALLSTLPVVHTRTFDLSYGRYEPRCAIEVRLDFGRGLLRVIATHLGLRPRERREQVRRILTEISREEETLTVLLGDINEWFMLGRPLRWLHAEFGHAPGVGSFPSFLPVLALDRVWAHPPSALLRVRAHASAEARYASDHLPVLAELALNGARSP